MLNSSTTATIVFLFTAFIMVSQLYLLFFDFQQTFFDNILHHYFYCFFNVGGSLGTSFGIPHLYRMEHTL